MARVLGLLIVMLAGQLSHTLHDEIGSQDTHGGDADAGLCGTVSSTHAGEDDGRGAAHGTKEGLDLVSSFIPSCWEERQFGSEGIRLGWESRQSYRIDGARERQYRLSLE